MRFLLLLLFVTISFAQAEPEITRFLYVSAEATCPGDIITMQAIGSDHKPAVGIELRLVLHSPYQGLRAVKTTDGNGLATAELTKPGNYRIYIRTDEYNHPEFVEFDYPELCPPPPPQQFNVTVEPDCNQSQLIIIATEEGQPLEDVFVSTEEWASTTNYQGIAVFPLEEGLIYITANRSGYSSLQFWADINCTPAPPPPPPECLQDMDCAFDQFCENETCVNITGECGYPENHSWIDYECCEDDDCGFRMICTNHRCIIKPAPPAENETEEEIEPEEEQEEPVNNLYLIAGLIAVVLLGIIIFLAFRRRSGL